VDWLAVQDRAETLEIIGTGGEYEEGDGVSIREADC
jgi:hypothetical protein